MKNTLCWECKNACGGCPWSKSFSPITGWDAIPIKIKSQGSHGVCVMVDSFVINKCPLFIQDRKEDHRTLSQKLQKSGVKIRTFSRYVKQEKVNKDGQILDKKLRNKYGDYLF